MSSRAGVRSSGAASPRRWKPEPCRSAKRSADYLGGISQLYRSEVLGEKEILASSERVLPLSGSTRRHQEAGLSAILMADAGSRRHSARRVLPGCDRQEQVAVRLICTIIPEECTL